MQAPQQYFTQCLLFSEGKPFCYFIPSVSYPFLIHFISVSYFQLQGDWMRFERGLLRSSMQNYIEKCAVYFSKFFWFFESFVLSYTKKVGGNCLTPQYSHVIWRRNKHGSRQVFPFGWISCTHQLCCSFNGGGVGVLGLLPAGLQTVQHCICGRWFGWAWFCNPNGRKGILSQTRLMKHIWLNFKITPPDSTGSAPLCIHLKQNP